MAARTVNESLSPDETLATRTDGLTRTFGSFTVADHLDLEIPTGIVYGLLGSNGAGKLTTLRIMITLLAPTRGRAMVLGHGVVCEHHVMRGLIGVTEQHVSVDEALISSKNLRLFERLLGLGRRRARERAKEPLAAFSLTEADDKRVSGCSGGMRRRLDLTVSLISRLPFIFLDELITGLDPRTREQMWDVTRSLVEGGSTILLTTQYLEEVDRLTHRVGIIDVGRLIAEGIPDEFKDRVGSSSLVLTPMTPGDQAITVVVIEWVTDHAPTTVNQDTHLQAPLSEVSVATEVLVALRDAGSSPRTVSVNRPSMDLVFMASTEQLTEHDDAAPPDATVSSAPSPASSPSRPADSQEQS